MGAWEIGPFGNDNAMDFIDELRLLDHPNRVRERVREVLQRALVESDLVEVDVAEAALAAVAIVAGNLDSQKGDGFDGQDGWEDVDISNVEELRELSLAVLDRVEGVDSIWMDDCIEAGTEMASRDMTGTLRGLLKS